MKYLFCLSFLLGTTISIAQCEDFTQTLITNSPACHGYSDGSITINATGGTGDLFFSITDVDGFIYNPGGGSTANTLPEAWYYTYVSDIAGCVIEDSIFLEDPGMIDVDLIIMGSNGTPDCDGSAIVDTVYNYVGDYDLISYFWFPNPSGVNGVGADSVYNFCPGEHLLTVNDENGCSGVIEFEIGWLASLNEDIESQFSLIPNSKTGEITVQFDTYTDQLAFEVYETSGKLIFKSTLNGIVTVMNPNLGAGTYIYAISDARSFLGKGKFVVSQ